MTSPCKGCGECCEKIGWGTLYATPIDLARWEAEGRDDILDHCCRLMDFADLWFCAETGDELDYCPFYRKDDELRCGIEETKPEVCAVFKCEKRENDHDRP